MKFAPALLSALLTTFAWSAHAAAKVEVSFLPADKYTDIGDSWRQKEDNLKEIGDYFQKVGAKNLADGQTLTLDFKDIDLAGRPNLFHRGAGDYRILTGGADWPRIKLHWLLQTPGAADRSGDSAMADMTYLQRSPLWHGNDSLPYEKRMIDEWFKKTFGTAPTATAPAP